MPNTITIISNQNKVYIIVEGSTKNIFATDSLDLTEIEALNKQLVFALKYEGINLLVFKN